MASLMGFARIDGPWRELIRFFCDPAVRVKYAMLVHGLTLRESMEVGGDEPAIRREIRHG